MTKAPVAWILCSNRWNSAITEYALSTARALQMHGWTIYYSALKDSPGAARAADYGLNGENFKSFGVQEALKLWRLARQIKPSAMLLFGGPETFLARLLPNLAKIRFRGQDSDLTQTLSSFKQRLNLQHCVQLLTPAYAVAERFAPRAQLAIKTIYLGIDTSVYYWNKAAWQQRQQPTMRIVGRFDPVKGHDRFFSLYQTMLRYWSKDRPQPILEIIGEAANISVLELKAMASKHGLVEGREWRLRVERVKHLGAVMSQTDLGIIPSIGSEVICRVAEEFLLCACPIFVSGVGSLEECLREADFGQSYRQLSEEQIGRQMAELLWSSYQESDSKREWRSRRAYDYFSLNTMGHELDRTLRPLI